MSDNKQRLLWTLLLLSGLATVGFFAWDLIGILAVPLVVGLIIANRVLPPEYGFASSVVLVAAIVGDAVTPFQAIGLLLGMGALIGAASIRNQYFGIRTVGGFLALTVVASGAVLFALETTGFVLSALTIAVTTAITAYGLHRYELVTLGLLTET